MTSHPYIRQEGTCAEAIAAHIIIFGGIKLSIMR